MVISVCFYYDLNMYHSIDYYLKTFWKPPNSAKFQLFNSSRFQVIDKKKIFKFKFVFDVAQEIFQTS